jgi:rubredoxin
MVKSWVCPKCLGDLDTFYIEEGDTMVTSEKIVCPNCGYTLEGAVGECSSEEAEEEA